MKKPHCGCCAAVDSITRKTRAKRGSELLSASYFCFSPPFCAIFIIFAGCSRTSGPAKPLATKKVCHDSHPAPMRSHPVEKRCRRSLGSPHPYDPALQVNVYEHGINLFKYHKLVFGAPKVLLFDHLIPLFASQKQFQLDLLGRDADFIQMNHPLRTNGTSKPHMERLAATGSWNSTAARAPRTTIGTGPSVPGTTVSAWPTTTCTPRTQQRHRCAVQLPAYPVGSLQRPENHPARGGVTPCACLTTVRGIGR